jgi:hypothetical protein
MSEKATSLFPSPERYTGLTEAQIRKATALVADTIVRHSITLSHNAYERSNPVAVRFDEVASQKHTAVLRDEVLNHGATIDRHGVRIPNTADFMERHEFDQSDMDAIGFYRGGGAQIINNYLRGGGGRPFERDKYERFMGLFAEDGKMPVTKGGEVVFRGMPNIQPGSVWQEKGFSSTTVSENAAKGFACSAQERDGTGCVMRMIMPPGVRYLPMGTGEEEVVFEPGLVMIPFDYDAFESGLKDIGTVDVLVQKAIPDYADATTPR